MIRVLIIVFITLTFFSADTSADPAETARGSTNEVVTSGTETDREYARLSAQDDAAQAEVKQWWAQDKAGKGSGSPDAAVKRRISERLTPVRQAYEEFIKRHPHHVEARLAYGSFLSDLEDEAGAQAQWERALELDPKNPAALNNLAGCYSEGGQTEKAFEYYTKAMELKPSEAMYPHNFANALYVLRRAAGKYYGMDEQQIYAKALRLFQEAARLDPTNYVYAADAGQTYYSLKPFPVEAALQAWTNAWKTATNDLDREDACLHLARAQMAAGRYALARAQLAAVTNAAMASSKAGLLKSIAEAEQAKP